MGQKVSRTGWQHCRAEQARVRAQRRAGNEWTPRLGVRCLHRFPQPVYVAEFGEHAEHLRSEEVPSRRDASADNIERQIQRVDESRKPAAEIPPDLRINPARVAVTGMRK